MTTADTTLQALLKAVLLDPADDCVRLVYADALDEAGQGGRAEFIRCQMRLAADPAADGPDEALARDAIRRRVERAVDNADHDPDWFLPPPWRDGYADGNWSWSGDGAELVITAYGGPGEDTHLTIRRGFVEGVTCPCADWLAHGPAVAACQPVTAVTLAGMEPCRTLGEGYMWSGDDEDEGNPWHVPEPLWGAELTRSPFPSPAAAAEALSRRSVAFGRERAGLPPLPGHAGRRPG